MILKEPLEYLEFSGKLITIESILEIKCDIVRRPLKDKDIPCVIVKREKGTLVEVFESYEACAKRHIYISGLISNDR